MTDAELDALERLCEQAASLPWPIRHYGEYSYLPFGTCYPCDLWISVSGNNRKAAAEFIAASRTAVPALCQEVRRLRADLAEAEKAIDTLGECQGP